IRSLSSFETVLLYPGGVVHTNLNVIGDSPPVRYYRRSIYTPKISKGVAEFMQDGDGLVGRRPIYEAPFEIVNGNTDSRDLRLGSTVANIYIAPKRCCCGACHRPPLFRNIPPDRRCSCCQTGSKADCRSNCN